MDPPFGLTCVFTIQGVLAQNMPQRFEKGEIHHRENTKLKEIFVTDEYPRSARWVGVPS